MLPPRLPLVEVPMAQPSSSDPKHDDDADSLAYSESAPATRRSDAPEPFRPSAAAANRAIPAPPMNAPGIRPPPQAFPPGRLSSPPSPPPRLSSPRSPPPRLSSPHSPPHSLPRRPLRSRRRNRACHRGRGRRGLS